MDNNHAPQNPADLYAPSQPSAAELMDTVRDCAINLSTAIREANQRGIGVHLEKAPEGSGSLIHVIYSV